MAAATSPRMNAKSSSSSSSSPSSSSSSLPHRHSLPSHLLWRSLLGGPAAWSGSSSRGVYLRDSDDDEYPTTCQHHHDHQHKINGTTEKSMIQCIPTDGRRMFHLPMSLRDAIVDLNLPWLDSDDRIQTTCERSAATQGVLDPRYNPHRHQHRYHHHHQWIQRRRRFVASKSSSCVLPTHQSMSSIRLLSQPRIIGAALPTTTFTNNYNNIPSGARRWGRWEDIVGEGRGIGRSNEGISCMDLDHGNGRNSSGSFCSSPPRYLLVGSGGGDCSIALYDLSCFGSDSYLYQTHGNDDRHCSISSQTLSSLHKNRPTKDQSFSTHRPIARSLRQSRSSNHQEDCDVANGIPSGHRHPLRGVHWYPADVCGAFVSTSISGEILVWDAQNFVPVHSTYSHVHSNSMNSVEMKESALVVGGKSPANIQCSDLPKTPEGCAHGSALLALGLGGANGVIQLCDAFHGGSATHELIGHTRNASGGGGVNTIAWDPHHPFRLASGGDDCTIRLWDIRKAGTAACLGVLSSENRINNDTHYNYHTLPSRKRQKAGISLNYTSIIMNGIIESHEAPVTAIAFAPYGDDLVSASLDGQMKHWDLRPDTCLVSSFAAIRDENNLSKDCRIARGGVDPSVSMGGRLMPTSFFHDTNSISTTQRSPSQRTQLRHIRASLAIIQPGSRTTATLLSTANSGHSSIGQITGYSLFGRRGKEPGGYPDFTLDGHLADVTCLVPVVGMWDNLSGGRYKDNCTTVTDNVMFFTGGRDGMVLGWGRSRYSHRAESLDEFLSGVQQSDSFFSQSTLQVQEQRFGDSDTW